MFFVECNPDEVLIKNLTRVSRKRIIHAGNNSGVIKYLSKKYINSKGVIDEDPFAPKSRLYKRFIEKEKYDKYKVKILYHNENNNIIYVLCPKLEDWLLEASREAKLDIKRYGLSNNVDRLKEEISLKNNTNYIKFIKDLIKKSDRLIFLKNNLLAS
jgi:hypothetical protein